MPLESREIGVEELEIGMFVAELDRPWLGTPFLFQGFQVTDQQELDTLRRLCRRVRISVMGTEEPAARRPAAKPGPRPVREAFDPLRTTTARVVRVAHPVDQEIASAKQAHAELSKTIHQTMDDLRSGKLLSVETVQQAAAPLVDSIERNPDALAWLTTMRSKDAGIYRHAVSVAVLVLTVGRHLGLPRATLENLAIGGLLFDVGKTRVPDSILIKADRLSDREFEQFARHVELGIEMLEPCRGITETTLSMVRSHHERHDGSGYPDGLRSDEIPAFGKIVGIADAYQTMLDSATAGRRLSAHDVLNYLNGQRGQLFDEALVEEFIQAVGIYPTGSLVQLSDGSVGVVVEQNRLRRLQPKVMLVLDAAQQPLPAFQTVDLMLEKSTTDALRIVDCLEPGAHGIDPEELFL